MPKRTWDTSGKRFGSTDKSKNELGFEANVDYKGSLRTTIEWTKNNLETIEKCISKHDHQMKKLKN